MKVAFYAPLKSPDHPTPSGDRQLARALLQGLRTANHEAFIASRFRSYDATGDAARQQRLATLGRTLARRYVRQLAPLHRRPDLWLTYHLYHKAPDWLGPAVSAALDIPYVVAEASVAQKQRDGRWASGCASSVAAVRAAAAILVFNPADVEGVCDVRGAERGGDLVAPFLDLSAFGAPSSVAPRSAGNSPVRLATVAMMRPGAKLSSYRLLAAALTGLAAAAWELVVIGDGPARAEVESAFACIPSERVRFAGFQPPDGVATLLHDADIFVWPAIDEAFGMAFIEAQASGLPVVAGDTGGVSAVVARERSGILVPVDDAEAFAAAMLRLIGDAELRQRMGRDAIAYAREQHSLPVAAARIDAVLRRVVIEHASRRHAPASVVAAP